MCRQVASWVHRPSTRSCRDTWQWYLIGCLSIAMIYTHIYVCYMTMAITWVFLESNKSDERNKRDAQT
jgi:hypothetical protein